MPDGQSPRWGIWVFLAIDLIQLALDVIEKTSPH